MQRVRKEREKNANNPKTDDTAQYDRGGDSGARIADGWLTGFGWETPEGALPFTYI
jgi:hypothetical protein